MRAGISTNPLSCQGFRSRTREKTAWDIPAPTPTVTSFDLFGWGTGLGEPRRTFPFPLFLSETRTIHACPGCGKRPASQQHHQGAVPWPRRREELEGRGWEGQAVEHSARGWILEPNSSSLCHLGSIQKLLSPVVVMGVLPCRFVKVDRCFIESPGGRNLIDVGCYSQAKALLP